MMEAKIKHQKLQFWPVQILLNIKLIGARVMHLKLDLEKLKDGSEIIITLDGDGQHKATDIPKLIKPILNGEADVVNGSRYLNGDDV